MLFRYRLLCFLAAACCTFSACKTQMADQPLTLDPELRTGKLPNGFTYYIRKNKTPQKRVMMYLAVKAGSILETEQQRGVAHFVEHMSFNGTKHFPKKQLSDYLEKSGVRFGADINANTGPDETVYQLPLPSDNPVLLANGLQIMRDWAQEATINAEDVNKERLVILEEKRYRQGLQQRYEEQSIPIYTNRSRYSSRLPIGTEAVLQKVTAAQIRAFYNDWYRPNLQAILVVGDIDIDQMERDIRKKFSDLKNPVKEKERPEYRATLTGKNQFMQFIDPELGGVSVEIVMKQEQPKMLSTSDYRNNLMKTLLSQLINARFRQLPFVSFGTITGGLMSMSVNVSSKPAELAPSLQSVWLELRRMQEQGFTGAELERLKKNYQQKMNEVLKEKDNMSSESLIKPDLAHFLTGNISPGVVKDHELSTGMLPGISVSEINELLKVYMKDTDRDIIVKASEKNKAFLPDEATLSGWIEAVYDAPLPPFVDDVQDLPLLIKSPNAGKITHVEHIENAGLQKITLSNGLTVLLKKTDFQNDQIVFKGFAEGGASLSDDADYLNALNAANVVAVSGAGNYNAQQLNKYQSGRQIQVSPFTNDTYQGFSGSTTKAQLSTALEVINAYFTEPRKDQEAFSILISRSKDELMNRSMAPAQVFMDTVGLVLGNYHLRRRPQTLKNLESIQLDKAYDIYKARFGDASAFTFIFVGNMDLESAKPLLEKYLGSLPSTGKNEKIRDLGINIPPGRIAKTVYHGAVQKSSVIMAYSGVFDYTFENTVRMNAVADALKIRLTQRLRDQEGGTYTPNVQMTLSRNPKSRFALVISFDCAVQNVDKLIASAQDELHKMRTTGPSEENLQKFKAARRLGLQTDATNNEFWLDYLSSQVMNQESLTQFYDYDAVMNKISVHSVQQAAATFIQDKNYIRLVLMPEKTKH